jgi:predicted transcriptional regulator
MIRTQIYLTDHEKTSLGILSAATGKAQSELIREAIDHFVAQNSPARRKAILADAAGMWKNRRDLPDFSAMRKQWDRDLPT